MDSTKQLQQTSHTGETCERSTEGSQKSESREDGRGSEPKTSIHRLPFEVIAYMFEFYTEDCYYREDALSLGAICKAWRHIAWTTPSLWTTLVFSARKNTTERQVQLAIGWLHRSGKMPLSVDLYTSSQSGEWEFTILPLIDVIYLSLARCRCLRLRGFSDLVFSRFPRYQGPSILRFLNLEPDRELTAPLHLGLQAAPTELSINNINLNVLVINWSNLTDFCARGLYLDEVIHTLTLAPRMVKCRQDLILTGISTSSRGYKPTMQSQLEDLFLDFCDESGLTTNTFFQNMTFPNLSYCQVTTPSPFPTPDFLGFLARSSCSIQTLRITSPCIPAEDLVQTVKALPSITTLILSSFSFNEHSQPPLDPFYRALCEDSRYTNRSILPGDVVLLPLLRRLSISTYLPFPWAWLPGFRHQSLYDGDTRTILPGRLHLEFISICRLGYQPDYAVLDGESSAEDPRYLPTELIDTQETISELKELGTCLCLQVKASAAHTVVTL
ncbi:hypothetical protein CVT25_009654 [Psilocybe cyanescens]|uniref:Uncharacterized protein n=1 Tax=Psilocybe cyanescens TaxID=93625 RepID=A0A409XGY7_PSICY|nr:hypothetical protein CVT25_009654 [Psilocybe cyanescens]